MVNQIFLISLNDNFFELFQIFELVSLILKSQLCNIDLFLWIMKGCIWNTIRSYNA